MVMAISASVTVSMGELTMGTESLILLVRFELMSTCACSCKHRPCSFALASAFDCCKCGRQRCGGKGCSAHLVGPEVNVARQEDNIIVCVCSPLTKELSGGVT